MIHCKRTSERRVKAPTPHKPPLSSCISSFCHSNLILFKSRHWHLLSAFSCEAHQHCVGGLRAKLLSPTEATVDAIEQLYQTSDTAQNGHTLRPTVLRIPRGATSDSNTSSRTSMKKNDKCTRDRAESATATSQPSWCGRVACFCLHNSTTMGGQK